MVSRAYHAWYFQKLYHTNFEISSMGIPFVILTLTDFSQMKWVKSKNTYKTYTWSLWFWKKSSKATNHSDSHIFDFFLIGTTGKESDIQQLSLWMSCPGDQALRVTSHKETILYIHLQWQAEIFGYSNLSTRSRSKYDSWCRFVAHTLLSVSRK